MGIFTRCSWLVVVAASFLAYSALTTANYCTVEEVNFCLGQIQQAMVDLRTGRQNSSADHYKEMCRGYKDSKPCRERIKPDCSPPNRKHIEVIEISFDYLCGDGFDLHVKHAPCIYNGTLRPLLEPCDSDYRSRLGEVSTSKAGSQAKKRRICTITRDMIQCSTDVMASACGPGAAGLVRELKTRSHAKPLEEYGCDLRVVSSAIVHVYNMYFYGLVLVAHMCLRL